MKPHRGTLVLVFGILGIVTCPIFGILAWIFGNSDLREMNAGLMDPSGRQHTNAGRICGIIGTVWMILCILAAILFFAFFAVVASSSEVKSSAPRIESTTAPER